MIFATSCKKDNIVVPITPQDSVVRITNNITTNTTFTSDKKYLLCGFIYVRDNAILTIEAGTIIKGDKQTVGTLIIERGSKLIAQGTKDKPIVFTSNGPKGYRTRGDWGGIILCGKAPVNIENPQIEGGPTSQYGGTDIHDNSGILKYVRIEYAGYPFQPDKEINGLTFAGVGDGTEIDYVQVSYSNDDSFEWFGGTVNVKHIVSLSGLDDDFDTDNGFNGKLQYLLAIREKSVADISGSNSFESDNDASGSDNVPITNPIFSNVTVFGPKTTDNNLTSNISINYKNAMHFRRNTKLNVFNSVFIGYPNGLLLDGIKCQNFAENGDLKIKNTYIINSDIDKFFNVATNNTWTKEQLKEWYFTSEFNNDTLKTTNVGLNTNIDINVPVLIPQSNSIVFGKSSYDNLNMFFIHEDFIGAFGNEDWTVGWCNFNPQHTDY
jgi:hypothetical protein